MKAEPGEKFWLRVQTYDIFDADGNKINGDGYLGSIESYIKITDEWTTVACGTLSFQGGNGYDKTWANGAVKGNITFTTLDCGEDDARGGANKKTFYIDDVQVTAPCDEEAEETVRTTAAWYKADFNDGTFGDTALREPEGKVYSEFVEEDGNKALHVTYRPVDYSGLEIDAAEMLKNTEIQDGDLGYSMGFRMKAEPGKKFWLLRGDVRCL